MAEKEMIRRDGFWIRRIDAHISERAAVQELFYLDERR